MTNQTFDSMAIFSNKLIIIAINHTTTKIHVKLETTMRYPMTMTSNDFQTDGNNVLTRMLFALREEGGVNGGQNEP